MPALIDVIIPVYNGADFVRDAIASIQNQTVRDIRIIIIDDGSTDQTPDILAHIAAHDPRLQVVAKSNGGIVDALNLGLSFCTADFIARHDADDLAYTDRFQVQLDFFNTNRDCVAQSCAVRHIDEAGQPVGSIGRPPPPERADAASAPAKEPYLIHPFLMMRREAVVAAGGYRYVFHSEDTDLYWRLREHGELRNLDRILGDYRMHGGSISGGSINNGRIMALSSQLSAISALRRKAGEPDLEFPKSALPELKDRSNSMQQLYDYSCQWLTKREAIHLKMAVSAKLIELLSYRPYKITTEDCRFFKSAAQVSWKDLARENRGLLRRGYSGTAAKLAFGGDWSGAAALIWPSLAPSFIYRLILRLIFPSDFRTMIRKALLPIIASVRYSRTR